MRSSSLRKVLECNEIGAVGSSSIGFELERTYARAQSKTLLEHKNPTSQQVELKRTKIHARAHKNIHLSAPELERTLRRRNAKLL